MSKRLAKYSKDKQKHQPHLLRKLTNNFFFLCLMKFPTDFTVKIKRLPMYIRMLKLNNGIFERSNIGLKTESELSLDLGALKYHVNI